MSLSTCLSEICLVLTFLFSRPHPWLVEEVWAWACSWKLEVTCGCRRCRTTHLHDRFLGDAWYLYIIPNHRVPRVSKDSFGTTPLASSQETEASLWLRASVQLIFSWGPSPDVLPYPSRLVFVNFSTLKCVAEGYSAKYNHNTSELLSEKQQWAVAWSEILVPCPGIEPR